MATAPQIALRDGSGTTTNLVFSTNEAAIFLTGTVSSDTASVQISINGGAFVTDPNLISFSLQAFTIPNLTVYPTGLPIEFGTNTILIRTIDIVGGVSATSSVIVTRITAAEITGSQIPTGVRARRYRDYVRLLAAKPNNSTAFIVDPATAQFISVSISQATFLGFNFYASTSPAGSSGYFRVNEKPIIAVSEYEEDEITTYDDIALWDILDSTTLRIRITEEDEFGVETAVRLDSSHDLARLAGKLRFTSTVSNYELNEFVYFDHYRAGTTGTINSDQFVSVPNSDPLYYVITGVYFDPDTNVEIETPYSQEILGTPLVLDTTISDLPLRQQNDIVVDYMSAILRVNTSISLIPGSTTRDIDIDPFASEAERLWFLLDFVHRSQSFLTLLAIDNVSGSGDSDPVATSAYKQALKAALGLSSDTQVQGLIDQQFDKLSGNVNKTRLPARPAFGTLTLYTSTRPTTDIQIPAGSFATSTADSSTGVTAQRFRIGGSYVMSAANAASYYNFNTKRYEIRVAIVAEVSGAAGNVPPGAIKSISGVNGLQAINESATLFGDDQETNAALAARAMLGFASVDTGTEGGYAATAAAKIGVIRTKIIKSGDALMMRDYDDVRHKHIGGKVDVWIQGVQERQVQDTFAFTFDVSLNVQCQVLSVSPTSIVMRVLDSRVTPETPLVEILDNLGQGLGVRNVTLGQDYNLTNVVISDYNTFVIDNTISQPVTTLDDVVVADYRFQVVNKLFMTLQPVRRVVSVVGEISGSLTEGVHYQLFKTDDPLLEGESTLAQNYVAITPSGGIPSGDSVLVNAEPHVMIGFEQEPLDSIGINTLTIRVFDEQRLVEFAGPADSAPDFDIIPGTPTTPAKIVRTAASTIANGQEVSVDYSHDENFTVTYVVNELLQQLQDIIENKRHVTADVLVKQAVQNELDIESTVQLDRGATKDKTDPIIRNAVSLELNKKLIGQDVAQSNVNAAINDSDGVQFNVLPMARMAYADGSQKLRESLLSTAVRVASLDIGGNIVYLLTNPLEFATTDGGGLSTEHKGVFQDDVAMTMSADLFSVGDATNGAFIIGSTGVDLSIPGYSDDSTLAGDGFLPTQYTAERMRRTANRVVVSLAGSSIPPDDPTKHEYAASYVIRGDSGSHDIHVSAMEAIDLGIFTVTYREFTGG